MEGGTFLTRLLPTSNVLPQGTDELPPAARINICVVNTSYSIWTYIYDERIVLWVGHFFIFDWGPQELATTVHAKPYAFIYFFSQDVVLFTMISRNR